MDLKRKQLLDRLLGRLLMLWLRPTVQILGFILRRDHKLELRDRVAVIKMITYWEYRRCRCRWDSLDETAPSSWKVAPLALCTEVDA